MGALADPRDREILSALVIDQNAEVSADPSELTAEGQLVFELFQRPGPERVEAILGALPPNSADRLAAVSPRPGVGQLRAHLYLMHDRSDHFIPYTHSRQLAAEAPAGTLRRYTEFDLFGHVMPNRQLDPPTFAREVAKLVWLAVDLGQEFL